MNSLPSLADAMNDALSKYAPSKGVGSSYGKMLALEAPSKEDSKFFEFENPETAGPGVEPTVDPTVEPAAKRGRSRKREQEASSSVQSLESKEKSKAKKAAKEAFQQAIDETVDLELPVEQASEVIFTREAAQLVARCWRELKDKGLVQQPDKAAQSLASKAAAAQAAPAPGQGLQQRAGLLQRLLGQLRGSSKSEEKQRLLGKNEGATGLAKWRNQAQAQQPKAAVAAAEATKLSMTFLEYGNHRAHRLGAKAKLSEVLLTHMDGLVKSSVGFVEAELSRDLDLLTLLLQEEHADKVDLAKFEKVLVTTLSALVPMMWDKPMEAAWRQFWKQIEQKLSTRLQLPSKFEHAMEDFVSMLSAEECKDKDFQKVPEAFDELLTAMDVAQSYRFHLFQTFVRYFAKKAEANRAGRLALSVGRSVASSIGRSVSAGIRSLSRGAASIGRVFRPALRRQPSR